MRDLTSETLNKLKPSWATHYRCNSGEVIFESESRWMAIGFNFPFIKRGPFKQRSKLTKCKTIPEFKAMLFDITKHEFSDSCLSIELNNEDGAVLTIEYYDSMNCLVEGADAVIGKRDAIAIAKALGITAKDLA